MKKNQHNFLQQVLFLMGFMLCGYAQAQELNQYKYALVPSKFSFLKEVDAYHLNTLSKLYLQKYGFETYLDSDTQPEDFVQNNCNKIFMDLIENNSLFATKITIVLKDCKGNILSKSEEATSREKEYAVAYNMALRMAFNNYLALKNHQYKPTATEKKEPEILHNQATTPIDSAQDLNTTNTFLAAKTAQGYLLHHPKTGAITWQLYQTSTPDVYLAVSNTIKGVVFKKNNTLKLEYFEENAIKSIVLSVQFQ